MARKAEKRLVVCEEELLKSFDNGLHGGGLKEHSVSRKMQILSRLQQKVDLFSEEDCVPPHPSTSDIPLMGSMMRRKRTASTEHDDLIPSYLRYLLPNEEDKYDEENRLSMVEIRDYRTFTNEGKTSPVNITLSGKKKKQRD